MTRYVNDIAMNLFANKELAEQQTETIFRKAKCDHIWEFECSIESSLNQEI